MAGNSFGANPIHSLSSRGVSFRLAAAWALVMVTIWASAIYIGRHIQPAREGVQLPRPIVEVLSTWDGEHYAWIAERGYSTEGIASRHFAFFPFFPMTARLLGGPEHARLAGILLSQLCLLGSMLILSRWAPRDRKWTLWSEPGFWLLVSPVAFFLSVFYSESPFLLLSLCMVVCYDRQRFGAAAVFGLLAGLARPTALTLPALFAWDSWQRVRHDEKWVGSVMCLLSPLAGIGIYLAVVGYRMGDPWAYLHIQDRFFGHRWTAPFLPFVRGAGGLLIDLLHGHLRPADQFLRLFSSLSFFALTIWGWHRLNRGFQAYVAASILFLYSQEPATATTRYELIIFPLFVIIAWLFTRVPKMAPAVAVFSLLMQGFYFVQHSLWHWVE